MKKLLGLIMALIMVFAISSVVACKGDGSKSSGSKSSNSNSSSSSAQVIEEGKTGSLEYELEKRTQEEGGNYYKVVKMYISDADAKKINNGEEVSVELVIPEKYKGVNVTEIAEEAFLNQKIITKATIPSFITKIGAGAFSGCVNLTEITLPYIGEKAVTENESGEKEGPVNEKKVLGHIFGTTAVDGATETKQKYNANDETTKSYYIPSSLTKVTYTGDQESLSEYAFNACTNLKEVVLNDNITTLPRSIFEGCTGIKEITLPSTIIAINARAFKGCENLLDVDLSNVETIGKSAFEGCVILSSRTNLVFSANLKLIQTLAFKGCTNLRGVDFSKNALQPPECLVIETEAFNACANLKEVIIGTKDTSILIESQAFSTCTKLEKYGIVYIDSSVKKSIFTSNELDPAFKGKVKPLAFSCEYLED